MYVNCNGDKIITHTKNNHALLKTVFTEIELQDAIFVFY